MNINLLYSGGNPNSIIMKKKLFNFEPSRIFTPLNLPILKNNKIILIKHFNNEIIKNVINLKKNKNIIIYEPIDFKWTLLKINDYINEMSIFQYVDKIILPSKYALNLLSKYIDKSKLYYN